jgi:hypothetical protein
MLVFAPLGFVLEARKLVPKLVERGKREVTNARVIGSFVTPIAKRNAEKYVRNRIEAIKHSAEGTGLFGSGNPELMSPDHSTESGATELVASTRLKNSEVVTPSMPPTTSLSAADLANPGALPIDGYDQLPSSTIVELLDRLTPDERRSVETYEQANRKRRTILTKARLLDSKRA